MNDSMPPRIVAIIDYNGERDGEFLDASMPRPEKFDDGVEYVQAGEYDRLRETLCMIGKADGMPLDLPAMARDALQSKEGQGDA